MSSVDLRGRDLLKEIDYTAEELVALLDVATVLKRAGRQRERHLDRQCIALIFEKPSTRTRVSFEVGIRELGGDALFLNANDIQLGRGEPIKDTARVLGRMIHGAVIRTFAQSDVEEFAKFSGIPTINALTDEEHPCQALADLLTVREAKGSLAGRTFTYLGDGNNVTHSLLLACAKAGMHVRAATPPGFEPIPQIVDRARDIAAQTGGSVAVLSDPEEASRGADVLYTDVWASMGQEAEAEEREFYKLPLTEEQNQSLGSSRL